MSRDSIAKQSIQSTAAAAKGLSKKWAFLGVAADTDY
jgi:hypothetical protein